MLDEVKLDISNGSLYYSERLSQNGKAIYIDLLIESVVNGNEMTFADSLIGMFNTHYERKKPGSGTTWVKMPSNANLTLAEGEFNRFYIRALCRKALDMGMKLKIYRVKFSINPRFESEIKIGTYIDAYKLLNDLRTHIGFDTVLGLPPGPNSGLSVELVN